MIRRGVAVIVLVLAGLLSAGVLSAPAALARGWDFTVQTNTTVAPGGTTHYRLQLAADGNASGNPVKLRIEMPNGLKATGFERLTYDHPSWSCASSFPTTLVICSNPTGEYVVSGADIFQLDAEASGALAPGAVRVARFHVEGAGAEPAETIDPVTIASTAPPFGLATLDGTTSADATGAPSTAAAGHPFDSSVSFDLNTVDRPGTVFGDLWPVEPLRDVVAELPAGLVGNPGVAGSCTVDKLANGGSIFAEPLCSPSSQVGVGKIGANGGILVGDAIEVPVFNMAPPPGVAARFGFNAYGTLVVLDAKIRSSGDYGVDIVDRNAPEGLPLASTTVTLWGTPASTAHLDDRACSGYAQPSLGYPTCPAETAELAFLRNPTRCASAEELGTTLRVDSWVDPGALTAEGLPDLSDPAWKSGSFLPHQLPAYPYPSSQRGAPVGLEGCGEVPFAPTISAAPTTNAADSPSGLVFDLTMPQQGLKDPAAISESDLREARVVLPQGMSVNPSSADGLGACSSAQIGLSTPVGQTPAHFSGLPAQCPDNAKIGTVEIETPLLDHKLEGSVYLAAQSDNPFGSLLAMYLVVEDAASGVVLKLPGEIAADPGSGRLETVFTDNPQLPFENLHLELFGGSRAALRTPACGTHTVTSSLTPWSGGADVHSSSSFQIDQGCGGGFDPHLSAGARNPLAGATSPFSLRLWRDDGSQQLGGLQVTLPPGLSGYLKGIPYCPDSALTAVSGELGTGRAQEASPSCPAASELGSVTVGAGAGPTPFYTSSGRAYLAGPYKGAPLSLAVVAPAVAGPFDLGSVVVRNALHVDPETAQITAVSDPLPTILHGIPLDLRDVRVNLDRPHFTLNPTSCNEKTVAATVTSSSGASATPSNRFQVGGCEALAFKPALAMKLKGKTNRGAHPALRALLRFPALCGKKGHRRPCPPSANIRRAVVALPHTEFLDQGHIRTICTRVQFAAGAGEGSQCPKGSVYGYAKAYSPLLDKPLSGPVFLRSSNHNLPDLVASLNGQIHVELAGRIDTDKHNGIRTTFAVVPDAPVSAFVLYMKGGHKGLLQNSTNVCASKPRARARFVGQNGKAKTLKPLLFNKRCHRKAKRRAHRKHKRVAARVARSSAAG